MYLLFRKYKEKNTWLAKRIKSIDSSLRYESTSRIMIEMILSLSISIFVNLFYGLKSGVLNIISFIVALSLLFLILSILFYSLIIPIVYAEEICTFPDLYARHCFLFLEFKTDKFK